MTTASHHIERIRPATSVDFRVVVPILGVMEKKYRGRSGCEFLGMEHLPVRLQDIKDGTPNPKLLFVCVITAEPG
jgi:hypothetical protein